MRVCRPEKFDLSSDRNYLGIIVTKTHPGKLKLSSLEFECERDGGCGCMSITKICRDTRIPEKQIESSKPLVPCKGFSIFRMLPMGTCPWRSPGQAGGCPITNSICCLLFNQNNVNGPFTFARQNYCWMKEGFHLFGDLRVLPTAEPFEWLFNDLRSPVLLLCSTRGQNPNSLPSFENTSA